MHSIIESGSANRSFEYVISICLNSGVDQWTMYLPPTQSSQAPAKRDL